MNNDQVLVLADKRLLIISELGTPPEVPLKSPFVTLLPAFSDKDRERAVAVTLSLIFLGAVEFCCVGPEAEQLHDALDEAVEDIGALDVVTTWDQQITEGCEYFLYAAGGRETTLLALVLTHPELLATLGAAARQDQNRVLVP